MGRLNVDGRVSIIIQAYNEETIIERSIMRACEQTYDNIEIVVANDGSTDNTGSIARRVLESLDIPTGYTETNGPSLYTPMGIQCPFIAGVGISTGEYIIQMGADDWLDSRCIEELLNNIGSAPAALPSTVLLDANMIPMPHIFPNYDFNDDMYSALVDGIGDVPYVRGPMMCRKDAFYRTRSNMYGHICWEWFMQLKMYSVGDIPYVEDAIHYHLMGNKSHVADGDSVRNMRLIENGYVPSEVFLGKYDYSNMVTLNGSDFRSMYYEIVARFGIKPPDKQENIQKLLWDKWTPIC